MEEVEIKKTKNWGLAFGIISFILGLLTLAPGYLAIIPLLGIAFAIITMVAAGVTIILGIIGVIGSKTKWPAIAGISLGCLMLAWGITRYIIFMINTSSSSNQ